MISRFGGKLFCLSSLRSLKPLYFNFSRQCLCSATDQGSNKNRVTSDEHKETDGSKLKRNVSQVVPRDFFDEGIEDDKEFLDLATSLERTGGLENLTTLKDTSTWDMVDDNTYRPSTFAQELRKSLETDNSTDEFEETDNDSIEDEEAILPLNKAFYAEDLGDHLETLPSDSYIPPELLNYTVPYRVTEEFPEPMLENFLPNTSPHKFRYDQQGERSCAGGKQRRGKTGQLSCHLIDMDDFHYLDVLAMRRFLTDDSEIMSRKSTGLCSRCQRQVAKTVKRARNLGLVPHIGDYTLQDSRPLQGNARFHDDVGEDGLFVSKTIL